MDERPKIPKVEPVGPFQPTLPKIAEQRGNEPMAVANDKQTIHGESFLATSAPLDAYDDEVARRYRQVPAAQMRAKSDEESIAAQSPPGFTKPDERGWARLEEEET